MLSGDSPTAPSAVGHNSHTAALNAYGPGYSSAPQVKNSDGPGADLQLVSLDSSTTAGFSAPTG